MHGRGRHPDVVPYALVHDHGLLKLESVMFCRVSPVHAYDPAVIRASSIRVRVCRQMSAKIYVSKFTGATSMCNTLLMREVSHVTFK